MENIVAEPVHPSKLTQYRCFQKQHFYPLRPLTPCSPSSPPVFFVWSRQNCSMLSCLVTSWSEQARLPHTDSSNYRNQQLGPIITSCSLCPRGPMVQLTRKLSVCLALHNLIWNDRVWHQGLLTLPATGPMCGNNLHCQIAPRLPLAEEARMSPIQTLAPPQTRPVVCNIPVQESYHSVITFCSSLAEKWRRCLWIRAGDAKMVY